MTDLEGEVKHSESGSYGPGVASQAIHEAENARRNTRRAPAPHSAKRQVHEDKMKYTPGQLKLFGPATEDTHRTIVEKTQPSLAAINELPTAYDVHIKDMVVRAVVNADGTVTVKAQQVVDAVAGQLAVAGVSIAGDKGAEGPKNASGSGNGYVPDKAEVLDALARFGDKAMQYMIMDDIRSLVAEEIRPALDSIQERLASREEGNMGTLKPTHQFSRPASVAQDIRSLVAEEIRPALDSMVERVAGCEADIKTTLARAVEDLRHAAAAQAAHSAVSINFPSSSASRTDGDSMSARSASIQSWAIQSYGTGSLVGADD